MGEIQLIAVRGEGSASAMDARTFADWAVRPRLLAVPGVSQVVPLGGEVRQYQVLVDPTRLAAYGVTLDEVLDAARGSSANASGGIFMDAGQEYLVRGTGRVRREDDIARTAVAVRGGTPVLIGDVAEVVIGPAPPIGRGSVNAGSAVILSIQRQPEANTLELTGRIDATLDEIEADLPAGIRIDRGVFRQATFIETAIGNVLEALRDSVILVILAVFLFLWSRRSTLISVLAIPLSLAGDGLRSRGSGDHDQHDDARGDGHRDRGARGRRGDRCRERLPPAPREPPAPARGAAVHRRRRPLGVHRDPGEHRDRDAHRERRLRAALLPGRPRGTDAQAAGSRLHHRGDDLARGRAHRDPGSRLSASPRLRRLQARPGELGRQGGSGRATRASSGPRSRTGPPCSPGRRCSWGPRSRSCR